ncbi:unnamed protein product [Soboliphyme baturini]|uniref:Fam20C domain-containing protein n=1 Tax=Soboliphyme baturini TaxID=241478 RepID=A0A183II47_9BILA|nr:unnamed protein product [Soboliphyme baturini]
MIWLHVPFLNRFDSPQELVRIQHPSETEKSENLIPEKGDCYGLYPQNIAEDWNEYLLRSISDLFNKEKDFTINRMSANDAIRTHVGPSSPFEVLWKEVADRTTADGFFDEHVRIEDVVAAVSSAKIVLSSVPKRGSQLKIELLLEGGQRALWKPKIVEITEQIFGKPYDGPDRHNSEIVAFHLSRILNIRRTPVVVGRKVHLKNELFVTSEENLKRTFLYSSNGSFCFYGHCLYCDIRNPVCADHDGYLEGSVVLFLPEKLLPFSRMRSPWCRDYITHSSPSSVTNCSLCRGLKNHSFFGSEAVFLDLIDMAVFDYLMGNADRHLLEFTASKVYQFQRLALLDNGKGLRNSNVDELSILAPLYQCCRIRNSTYLSLLRFAQQDIATALDTQLRVDHLYPVLTEAGLAAIYRRHRHVLALLRLCVEKYGLRNVVRS